MDENVILKYALQNAVIHGGKASFKAVLAHLIAKQPEIKSELQYWMSTIHTVIDQVNAMTIADQRAKLERLAPELLIKKKVEEHKVLEPLPNVVGTVRMRLAPSPSGPLHIGHSRMAILNDEYVKRYGGILFLRIEDTNPYNIDPDAYHMIPEDLDWLKVKYHKTIIQSARFEKYYEVAKKLLKMGKAYITQCPEKEWRALKLAKKPSKDRGLDPAVHLERWDKMLAGEYADGEAAYIVKTDLNNPNPALRDWVAFRIITRVDHPLVKNKYIVYPLMNFAVTVDDHLLNLTHVLRGKDHLNNTYRQLYLFRYLNWAVPEYIHYGRIRIAGTVLKTSIIKKGIRDHIYSGWADPRLGTLRAIANRGITPEAIRKYWIDVGLKKVDIEFSWTNLYAYNKAIIDDNAKRLFFVWNPVFVQIQNTEKLVSKAPYHPNHREYGYRSYEFTGSFKLYVTMDDWNALHANEVVRLKDLCNIKKLDLTHAQFAGNDRTVLKKDVKIIHWAPEQSPQCKVYMPDGSAVVGVIEPLARCCVNTVVQFERFGFVHLKREKDYFGYFTHK